MPDILLVLSTRQLKHLEIWRHTDWGLATAVYTRYPLLEGYQHRAGLFLGCHGNVD